MSLPDNQPSPIRFIDSRASVHFDLLRGLAAFFVIFGHWRNLLFVDFPQLHGHRLLLAPLYVLADAGHQAVIVFFVLSGYFIGGTVLRSLERQQWEWRGYLMRRIVRLWTVLIPALLLCLFWDRLGIHLGLGPALYDGRVHNNVMFTAVAPLLMPHIFFGNLFFLQTILTPVLGSDGALWSLAYEFWYYVLFPLAVIAMWRTARPMYRLFCAVLFVATAWFVGSGILLNFPIWLAGVALFKMRPPSFTARMGRRLRVVASLLYAPIFFALGRLSIIPPLLSDYFLTVATFFFLWIVLSDTSRYAPAAHSVRASREMARFSYTLYAAHLPFLIFFTALFLGDERWYPTPVHLLFGAGLLLLALLYSYVLAFLTEFRTDALRQRVERLFGMRSAPPTLPSNPLSEVLHSEPPLT